MRSKEQSKRILIYKQKLILKNRFSRRRNVISESDTTSDTTNSNKTQSRKHSRHTPGHQKTIFSDSEATTASIKVQKKS